MKHDLRKQRAVGLVRLSTEEQADHGRAGVLRQKADIQTVAECHGLEIERVVELVAVSGATTLEAPELQEMLADLARPDIDGVIVSDLDRLGWHNSLGDLVVFDQFFRHGKLIWTPGEVIDVRQDSGFLTASIWALMAGMERTASDGRF